MILSEIYTQVQSRCVLVVMLYGTDGSECQIWEDVRCWCGYEVFVYKMFGLLESTMGKTRQSPYLLMFLLVSPGGCPLFEWNCAVRCLCWGVVPRVSCGFWPVLMSWFPLWALGVLLGLCRDPLVYGLLGVLVLHSFFLMGLVSTLATFGSMVGPAWWASLFVSLHATRSLWAVDVLLSMLLRVLLKSLSS